MITMINHILLTKIADIVMIRISLGIEFKISIPLETKVSIGTLTSLDNQPNLNTLERRRIPTMIAAIKIKEMTSSQIPLPEVKAFAKVYFLTPKP